MARNTTVERILDGTLIALARHGQRKLSMSDICEQAGVSRGTLYRYFNNKEEVLEALGEHVENGVRERLAAAIAERPDPEHRLRTILEVVIDSRWLQPEAVQILEVEPEFGLAFIRNSLPQFVKIVADALKPAAPYIPAVRDRSVTIRQLAELTLRIGASTFFLPDPGVKDLPKRIERLIGVESTETARRPRRSSTTGPRKAG